MDTLGNAVVVITGASSGIGRATARSLARAGAMVIVASRGDEKLEDVVDECRNLGGECVAVPCDVSIESDVQTLADQVVDSFERIDVWINNAAVTAFGRIDEMPYELYRQVIDTNLFGYVHGCRAAIAQFRRQGFGTLINVASVAGKVSQPLTSAYCASKFGIIGLSDSLRMELRNYPDIHVCTVLPPSIDTPLFQHGANYVGRQARPIPPIYSAQQVADAIIALARKPRREVAIGAMGKALVGLQRLSPALAERMVARKVEREHFSNQPELDEIGNLIEPVMDEYEVSGGWKQPDSTIGAGVKLAVSVGAALAGTWAIYLLTKMVWSGSRTPTGYDEALDYEQQGVELRDPTHVPEGAYSGT